MYKYTVLCIFLLFFLCVTHGEDTYRRRKKSSSDEFDILIFTQSWPLTNCFVWKKRSESNSCLLPKHEQWTIHGIWPTRYHTNDPQYCDKSLSFNASVLAPIESQLKENWIDIHNGSKHYSFWKHEWDKHGTCAITINAMSNQLKYFRMGLTLLDTYNMVDVLTKARILPGQKYTVQNLLQAIERILGKKATIICTKNKDTGELYMLEIRICFDKYLRLIDCDGTSNFPTNCDQYETIMYPGRVPKSYNIIQV